MRTIPEKVRQIFTAGLLCCLVMPVMLAAQPLSGNYTLDAGQPTGGVNFHSFTDFANTLNGNGVSGPVIVTVAPGSGPYVEQVVINTVAGAGPNATVTLEGSGETLTHPTTTTDRHILRLSHVQYFTVNNLHIARDPASTGGFYGIHLYGTASHVTISNCSVDMSGSTSTLYGAYIASGSLTSILETGDFHDVTITSNFSTGGGYGASLFGLVSNLASNIVISNNTFLDFHTNGIYLRETNGAEVSGNFLDKTTANVTTVNAIQLAQAANINGRIFNNTIQCSQSSNGSMTFRGIYLFNGAGHRVWNNQIFNINLQSGNFTGIEIRTGGTAPEICFNTISADHPFSTTGNLYGIKEELSNTNSILRNNIISLSQPTSGIKSALVLGSTASVTSAFNSDYNLFNVPGGNVGQKGTMSPVFYTSLASWQGISGQDAHSQAADPAFLSLLYPLPTNVGLDNLGTAIAWVTYDIMGVTRGNPPDFGAYEFSSGPPPAPDTIYGEVTVCAHDTVVYSVTPVPGATGYLWTVSGNGTILTPPGPAVTVEVGTISFTVTVIVFNDSGTSTPVSLNVTVNPLPQVSLILPIDTVCHFDGPFLLSGGTPPGGNYSGNGVSAGDFTPWMTGPGYSVITYTYLDSMGCAGHAVDSIFVEICVGIGERRDSQRTFSLSPNPARGFTLLRYDGLKGRVNVVLRDALGVCVKEFIGKGGEVLLDLTGLPAGAYFVTLMNDGRAAATGKLIIL